MYSALRAAGGKPRLDVQGHAPRSVGPSFFSGIDRAASANSLNGAVQIQSGLVRARGEVLGRCEGLHRDLGKPAADGAKNAQDNFSKVYTKTA